MKKKLIVEKTRHTDEDLEEIRVIIVGKLEKANNDLILFKQSISRDGENGTDDTSPTFKILEEGNHVYSTETNGKFAARQEKFIKSLENALIRVENKTLGVCRVTGKLIPMDRLRSVPHATLSIEAKRVQATKNCHGRPPDPDLE